MGAPLFLDDRTSLTKDLSRRFSAAGPVRRRAVKRVATGYPCGFTRRNDGLSECRIAETRFRGTETQDRQTRDSLHLRGIMNRKWLVRDQEHSDVAFRSSPVFHHFAFRK